MSGCALLRDERVSFQRLKTFKGRPAPTSGCLTQVRAHPQALGSDLPRLHVIQVLDRAYARGE